MIRTEIGDRQSEQVIDRGSPDSDDNYETLIAKYRCLFFPNRLTYMVTVSKLIDE